MLNYFYDVLPPEIQEYIWVLTQKSRIKDMHDDLNTEYWLALRNSADNAEKLEAEEAIRINPTNPGLFYYWHPQNNVIARRLHDIRRIKELHSKKPDDSDLYLTGFNYYGSHYYHNKKFYEYYMYPCAKPYIESLTKDGRTITYSMMKDSYWYPNIGPYIKNIEVFHRWTRNNHFWWRKCVYQERPFRDACKEMNKKEIQDYLKRAGLKGFSKMNKTQLIHYYYTESKTRKLGRIH